MDDLNIFLWSGQTGKLVSFTALPHTPSLNKSFQPKLNGHFQACNTEQAEQVAFCRGYITFCFCFFNWYFFPADSPPPFFCNYYYLFVWMCTGHIATADPLFLCLVQMQQRSFLSTMRRSSWCSWPYSSQREGHQSILWKAGLRGYIVRQPSQPCLLFTSMNAATNYPR